MKKILLTAIVAVAALSSCQKERDCTCTFDFLGATTSTTTTVPKASKSDQKAACEALNTTSGYTCELD